MLKAVIMDMDGTLYRQPPVQRRMALRLLQFTLRNPSTGWRIIASLRAYRHAQEWLRTAPADQGGARDQLELACRATGFSSDFVRRSVENWMEIEPLAAISQSMHSGVMEFADWARRRGLKLAVVSDYDPRKKIEALGLIPYIDVAVWAQEDEVGVFKPKPRGLEVALRRLSIEPDEAIYVGDRPEVDGAAAIAAKVPGILLGRDRSPRIAGLTRVPDWPALKVLLEAGDFANTSIPL